MQLHCLPGPGGVLDQDGYIMMGLTAAIDAISERQNKEEGSRIAAASVGQPY